MMMIAFQRAATLTMIVLVSAVLGCVADRTHDNPARHATMLESGDSRVAGDNGMPIVTVIEYADFQCPACRRFALTHWPSVAARFGDTVSLVFRHWPQSYHPYAHQAAVAAVCAARQGRFQAMHDQLYEEQALIGAKSFKEFGRESGVADVDSFERCLSSRDAAAAVTADIREARVVGGVGTPTLVIEGVRHRLRADTTWLRRHIDSILDIKVGAKRGSRG